MSPHGSKLMEFVRFLANRLLTDQQRKRIKTILAKMQQVPLKLLGVDSLIHAQKEEIERLKSRLTILDGKFNLALYGMPTIDEKYRAISVTNSFLSPFLNQYGNDTHFQNARFTDVVLDWLKKLPELSLLSRFDPKRGLAIGLDFLDALEDLFQAFPDLSQIYLNESNSKLLKISQDCWARKTQFQLEWLGTDPTTALLALSGGKLDLIVCLHRYQRLAPVEQNYFLNLVQECLTPGGIFLISTPNLLNPEIACDGYWSDCRNLRPYSASLLHQTLDSFSGKLEKVDKFPNELFWVYRKSGIYG